MVKTSSGPLRLAKSSHIKMLLAIALILIGVLAAWIIISPNIQPKPPTSNIPSALPVAPAAETKQSPWRLSISAIGVDAAIQEVGLTKEGDMGVPSNYTDVAWLKTGPRPGEPGNAVLAGHLNAGVNKPAVFENLHKLKTGDIVTVKDKTKNEERRFRVINSESYDVNRAPLEKIFGATTETLLNLITCSGNWDKTKQDYDERLVVFTELAA